MTEKLQTGDTVEVVHYDYLIGTLGGCGRYAPEQDFLVWIWEVHFPSGSTWWVAEHLLRRIEVAR